MEDNVKFCPACGEPQQVNADPVAAAKDGLDKLMKNKKQIGIIAGIAVAAIVVLIILVNLFTPGYKKAAKKFFKAMASGRMDKMIDRMPDFMTEDLDKSDIKDMQKAYKELMSEIKMSYKITNSEKLDKDEIEALEAQIERYFDEEVNIKKAYKVYAKLTAKKGGDKDTQTASIYVIKLKSKWYVYSRDFDL